MKLPRIDPKYDPIKSFNHLPIRIRYVSIILGISLIVLIFSIAYAPRIVELITGKIDSNININQVNLSSKLFAYNFKGVANLNTEYVRYKDISSNIKAERSRDYVFLLDRDKRLKVYDKNGTQVAEWVADNYVSDYEIVEQFIYIVSPIYDATSTDSKQVTGYELTKYNMLNGQVAKVWNSKTGLPSVFSLRLKLFENNIYATSERGVYKINPLNDEITRYDDLDNLGVSNLLMLSSVSGLWGIYGTDPSTPGGVLRLVNDKFVSVKLPSSNVKVYSDFAYFVDGDLYYLYSDKKNVNFKAKISKDGNAVTDIGKVSDLVSESEIAANSMLLSQNVLYDSENDKLRYNYDNIYITLLNTLSSPINIFLVGQKKYFLYQDKIVELVTDTFAMNEYATLSRKLDYPDSIGFYVNDESRYYSLSYKNCDILDKDCSKDMKAQILVFDYYAKTMQIKDYDNSNNSLDKFISLITYNKNLSAVKEGKSFRVFSPVDSSQSYSFAL